LDGLKLNDGSNNSDFVGLRGLGISLVMLGSFLKMISLKSYLLNNVGRLFFPGIDLENCDDFETLKSVCVVIVDSVNAGKDAVQPSGTSESNN
jgi:hypothetical protein